MSVYKRAGQSVYSYDFQLRGQRFSGSTGCTLKRDAERFEKAERDRVKAGEVDLSNPLTFVQAANLWWDQKGQHHRNHIDTERALVWLTDAIGAKTLIAGINDSVVARLVSKRRGESVARRGSDGELHLRPVSNATVNRSVLEPLRAIMRRAELTWGCTVTRIDWATHVLGEPQERVREASGAEEALALASIRGDYADALRFAFLSGCRRAEIVGLTWPQVNFFAREFRVVGKGDRARTIPMTEKVFDLLWAQRGRHAEAVFTYEATRTRDGRRGKQRYPITLEGFKTAWRRQVKPKLPDFRFHDTRHTAATRLVRETGNLKLAQRLLGHSEIATTGRYAHVTNDDLRQALEKVDGVETGADGRPGMAPSSTMSGSSGAANEVPPEVPYLDRLTESLAVFAYPPRGMHLIEAARYVGLDPTLFGAMVRDGRMPRPKDACSLSVWDRVALDASFAGLPSLPVEGA